MSGGPFILAPRSRHPLGLVLHELATNAAKYGALSGDEGQVKLAWRNVEIGDGPGLELVWQERGGPKVITLKLPERAAHSSRTASPAPA